MEMLAVLDTEGYKFLISQIQMAKCGNIDKGIRSESFDEKAASVLVSNGNKRFHERIHTNRIEV